MLTSEQGLIVGPPLEGSLVIALGGKGNFAFQGVDYPATIAGFLEGGDPGGAATMAALASQAVSQCPGTQVVLGGYRYVFGRR